MKNRMLILIFLLCCGFINIQGKSAPHLFLTFPSSSFISSDHSSEGFLIKCDKDKGKIINIFRLDPGKNGDHIGNNGKIVKRISYDNGKSWSSPVEVYDSFYDDRNIHGGITKDNKIIFFFRRYDAVNKKIKDIKYFYSEDCGESFKGPFSLESNLTGGFGTDLLTYIPYFEEYMLALNGHRNSQIEFYFSQDGKRWKRRGKGISVDNKKILMNESCFSYIGNNTIIGLVRSLDGKHAYYQVVSYNNGNTWTNPTLTNIASTYNMVAPLCYYVKEYNSFLVIATDRRKPYFKQSLKIYFSPVPDILQNPKKYRFISKVNNKESIKRYFYGYPTLVKINSSKYLVIYTDNYTKINGKENANLYQFYINIKY